MLVKLQRPPPEMRIFFPCRSARSRTATRRPRLPASMAHSRPAAPSPSITASNLWTMIGKLVRPSPCLTIMAFLGGDWTGHALATPVLEFQTFAISRIDFVDWTFHEAGVKVGANYLRTEDVCELRGPRWRKRVPDRNGMKRNFRLQSQAPMQGTLALF